MNACPNPAEKLRRCKSMCSLSDEAVFLKIQTLHTDHSFRDGRRRSPSDSSMEVYVVNDSDSDALGDGKYGNGLASGLGGEVLAFLEQKIDRLSDLFLEQCKLLSSIKDDIGNSKEAIEKSGVVHNQLLAEIVNKTITQRMKELTTDTEEVDSNSRARSLLDALQVKRASSFEHDIREALATFLQSDELRERMATSTSTSMHDVVRSCVSRDVSTIYLPILERSHRRLLRHVSKTLEDAFSEMEENSSQLSKQMFRASRNLRRTLEKHIGLLDAPSQTKYANSLRRTVEELLDKELKQWRQKVLDVITAELQPEEEQADPTTLEYSPLSPFSPPQPANPEVSMIDQLMKSAMIKKQILEGDVEGSFAAALSAADLALVVAACRAADARALFRPPCALSQPVLLSLAQQLATDMLHDTHLKCRYLEDAIINLNTSNPATRAHLPTVVGEVRKHLTQFLQAYPNHIATRRITLIVMAADNLLKICD